MGAVALAACGESEATSCVGEGTPGEVCVIDDGSLRVRSQGLLPGSEVDFAVATPEWDEAETITATMTVGEDGAIEDGSALLIGDPTQLVIMTISATAADGQPIEGELQLRG